MPPSPIVLDSAKVLGRFLHHTPAEAMSGPSQASEGLKRAWRLSCVRQGINPLNPDRLPLLFAIDQALRIPDGYHYAPDCRGTPGSHCASRIGCTSGCGGSSPSWFSGSSEGSAASGSDGGGGCGGGD